MLPAGFEPAIPASKRTQDTHALNRATTEISVRRKFSDVEFMFTKHPRNVLGDTDGISNLPAKLSAPPLPWPQHTHTHTDFC